jgi:hypothetical protein
MNLHLSVINYSERKEKRNHGIAIIFVTDYC